MRSKINTIALIISILCLILSLYSCHRSSISLAYQEGIAGMRLTQ